MREAGVEFDWLTGADITEAHWDQFFAFYMDTGGRKWGRPYLTRDFFSRVGRQHGRPDPADHRAAGRPLHRRRAEFLRAAARCSGATGAAPNTSRSCISRPAIIRRSISPSPTNSRKVEAGAQGEHKLLRGYLPTPTYSAHFIAHAGLRRAVADYLAREREAVAEHIEELAEHGPFRKTSTERNS